MARNDGSEIEVGQRFYRVGQFSSVWIVKQVLFAEDHSLPHAAIERHDSAGEVDVIPLYVLEDPSNYRPDRRSLQPADPTTLRRRAADREDETV